MSPHTRKELVDSMSRSIATLKEDGTSVFMLQFLLMHGYQEPKKVTEARESLFRAALEFMEVYGYRWFCRSSQSILDYDDLVSSTMLRAIENLETFHGSNGWAFLQWLLSIALSVRRKEFRRLERYRRAAAIAASPGVSNEASPDSNLEAREDREKRERFVRSALKLLPKEFNELLTSQFLEGLTINDLSILYGLTPNTVKTKLRRGKLRLQCALRGMGLKHEVIEAIEPFDARFTRCLDPELKRILFISTRGLSSG